MLTARADSARRVRRVVISVWPKIVRDAEQSRHRRRRVADRSPHQDGAQRKRVGSRGDGTAFIMHSERGKRKVCVTRGGHRFESVLRREAALQARSRGEVERRKERASAAGPAQSAGDQKTGVVRGRSWLQTSGEVALSARAESACPSADRSCRWCRSAGGIRGQRLHGSSGDASGESASQSTSPCPAARRRRPGSEAGRAAGCANVAIRSRQTIARRAPLSPTGMERVGAEQLDTRHRDAPRRDARWARRYRSAAQDSATRSPRATRAIAPQNTVGVRPSGVGEIGAVRARQRSGSRREGGRARPAGAEGRSRVEVRGGPASESRRAARRSDRPRSFSQAASRAKASRFGRRSAGSASRHQVAPCAGEADRACSSGTLTRSGRSASRGEPGEVSSSAWRCPAAPAGSTKRFEESPGVARRSSSW